MIFYYILWFSIGIVTGLIIYHYSGFYDERVKILQIKIWKRDMEIELLNKRLNRCKAEKESD